MKPGSPKENRGNTAKDVFMITIPLVTHLFSLSLETPCFLLHGASLVAQTVKRLPAMRETQVQFLGREDPLEKEMAIHSRTLAWKSHGRRSLIGYSLWGLKESDMTERLHFSCLVLQQRIWFEDDSIVWG